MIQDVGYEAGTLESVKSAKHHMISDIFFPETSLLVQIIRYVDRRRVFSMGKDVNVDPRLLFLSIETNSSENASVYTMLCIYIKGIHLLSY